MGIEPTYPAWKAGVLPLNYTRMSIGVTGFEPATSWSQTRRSSQAEPHPVVHLCVANSVTQIVLYMTPPHMSTTFLNFFQKFFSQILQMPESPILRAFSDFLISKKLLIHTSIPLPVEYFFLISSPYRLLFSPVVSGMIRSQD